MSTVSLNFDEMTIDDLEILEEASGLTAAEMFQRVPGEDGQPVTRIQQHLTARVLRAIVFIAKRREDPEYTMEDAGRESFAKIDFGGGEEDPSEPES